MLSVDLATNLGKTDVLVDEELEEEVSSDEHSPTACALIVSDAFHESPFLRVEQS